MKDKKERMGIREEERIEREGRHSLAHESCRIKRRKAGKTNYVIYKRCGPNYA